MSTQEAEQRILDGSTWNDFCDRLKDLGQLIQREENPKDVQNQALGYRYLSQLLRAGLEMSVDFADPQFPCFFQLADETKKMLNDNPDAYYQNCVIDGQFDYRITGNSGATWFGIGAKGSAESAGAMVNTGQIDMKEIELNSDGSFEVIVSATEKPGNWLKIKPETKLIIARQTFAERRNANIEGFKIECLNPQRAHNTLTPEGFDAALARVTGFIGSTVNMNIDWMQRYSKHINGLPEDDQALCQAAGGDPNIHYYQSYWKLADDEALVVHFTDIPECEDWNFQLSNYWMQSLDFRFFDISINKATAVYRDDGSVEIVVAHQNPGPKYPNWLDTCEHDQGGMLGRYFGAKNPPAMLGAKVVKFSEL